VVVVLGQPLQPLQGASDSRTGLYVTVFQPRRVFLRGRGRGVPDLLAEGGLAPALVREVRATVARGEQALLFLNRRGYAPVLLCPTCGWTEECPHCDRPMTYHQSRHMLLCHLCGHLGPVPAQCRETDCGNPDLQTVGLGVEQVEQAMAAALPEARLVRIDRDTTRRKGSLERKLDAINHGEADVIIGTQMVVKGHHFPRVTLVGVVAADGGLYSADFRARERLFQQVLQVAGRAGRAERPGRVWVQTFHPDHAVFAPLRRHDYAAFADMELAERNAAGLPPYAPLALLRAEGADADGPRAFLEQAREAGYGRGVSGVHFLGPAPAPVERLQGQYRAQLLVSAPNRATLHRALTGWAPQLEALPGAREVRWSLDVDPADLF